MKFVIALVLAASALPASAVNFEMGIGGSGYQDRGDGFWIQEGFPNKMQMAAPAFEVGITGDAWTRGRYGLAWHADWVWLGTIHTSAQATPSDENYNLKTKSCNGPCWPMSTFNGSGHDQGFIFTLEPYVTVGGYRLGVEAGPYLHKSIWSENVPNWRPSPDAEPTPIAVQNENRWAWGSVVGASISRGNFTLSYKYFANKDRVKDHDTYGAIWASTQMVTLKYKF